MLGLLAVLITGQARAGDNQDREDFFGSYTHRIEGVTVGAGDAAASNAASQIIDPWPAYAHDRRILSNSQRMIGAIQRYRANSGAKPLQVQTNAQPRDGAESGAQDDAPDTAKSPSSNVSAGE
jgi:hypothetical protein